MSDPLTIIINIIAVAVSLYQLAWLRSLERRENLLSKWQDAQEEINRTVAGGFMSIELEAAKQWATDDILEAERRLNK